MGLLNNDLISRSALLKALENDRMVFKSTITVPEALLAQGEHWRRCLESAPAVDAVPVKRAVWKLHKNGSGTCSNCRFTLPDVWDYDNYDKYCSHCGAKMRLKGDQNE